MLYYLPLEYLDKRYTTMMDKQIQEELQKQHLEYTTIEGESLPGEIQTGAFLDSDSTNHFKFSQLQKVCVLFREGKIRNRDTFFVSDLWFPGLISIPYMAMFHDIKVKICGIFHAGSWTPTDYVNNLSGWARNIEQGWLQLVNEYFVGSEFHVSEIFDALDIAGNFNITGLPFSSHDILAQLDERLMKVKKENIVIFNGRLDDEKQPWIFDLIERKINNPDVQFIKTMELDLNKTEYFNLLARSKVVFSAALQENFGYGILEAVALKCTPCVPKRLAYTEYYQDEYMYSTIEEAVDIVKRGIDYSFNHPLKKPMRWFNEGTKRIVSRIQEVMIK